MTSLVITGDAFHPEWNYTIKPRRPAKRSSYFTEHPKLSLALLVVSLIMFSNISAPDVAADPVISCSIAPLHAFDGVKWPLIFALIGWGAWIAPGTIGL